MSASDDERQVRRRPALAPAGLGAAAIRDDPFLDFRPWKQQLAGNAAHRQRPLPSQFIDFSLLHAKQGGKLSGRKKFGHAFLSGGDGKIT